LIRKIIYWLTSILGVVALLAIATLKPAGDKDLADQPFYLDMMSRLDTIKPEVVTPTDLLKAGWCMVNITPEMPFPMAGYKPRRAHTSVQDSLFARILVLDNGPSRLALLSLDLLMFPPTLKEALTTKIPDGIKLYCSATHTHNGFGGWDPSFGGQIIAGDYQPEMIDALSDKIIDGIETTSRQLRNARLGYFESAASEYVTNRLDQNAPIDGKIRGIQVIRNDSTSALLSTYSAHPTNIPQKSLALSGDYPAALNRYLVAQKNIDFAMFMAGMVGSHRLTGIPGDNFIKVSNAGSLLGQHISDNLPEAYVDSLTIQFIQADITFGASQLKLNRHIAVRDWVFRSIFGPLNGEVTLLALNDIVFVGLPCDFSGEVYVNQNIDRQAERLNIKPIVTSFNGGYVGYVIEDEHYFSSLKEEANVMNWVGPHYDRYFSDIIIKLMHKTNTEP